MHRALCGLRCTGPCAPIATRQLPPAGKAESGVSPVPITLITSAMIAFPEVSKILASKSTDHDFKSTSSPAIWRAHRNSLLSTPQIRQRRHFYKQQPPLIHISARSACHPLSNCVNPVETRPPWRPSWIIPRSRAPSCCARFPLGITPTSGPLPSSGPSSFTSIRMKISTISTLELRNGPSCGAVPSSPSSLLSG